MLQIPGILIVEDDADWLEIYSTQLASEEYNITTARTVKKATKLLEEQDFAVVATDLKLLGASTGGFDILEMVRERRPDTQVIIFTGVGGKQDAFEAMRKGAYDYVTKPLEYNHVKQVIKSAIDVREQKLSYRRNVVRSQEVTLPFPQKFVGSSQIIKVVLTNVLTVINSSNPVLIWGASGTGKALITETIHLASKRKRLVLVNCASFSETTLERILFGFQKDAFPGAVEDESGLLEQASGGTLVLDKVDGLSPRLQNQLCAALRHQRSRRLGSAEAIPLDVRVLATTQLDLNSYVTQHLFLQEFCEYLGDSIIQLPTLKDRKDDQTDDVLLLAGYFLDKYAQGDGPPPTIAAEAKSLLQTYEFPGNVRELEEAIRIALAQAKSGIIEPYHLPQRIQNQRSLPKIAAIKRRPLSEDIICPHGYSLTHQADAIAQVFDREIYVYLSMSDGTPAWARSTLADVLTQFGLKSHDAIIFPNSEDFCPVCQPLLSSCLAILEISAATPVVFYELGLAQATGLPCAILKRQGIRLPAKLGRIDLLEYHDVLSLKECIVTWLNHLGST